MILESPYELRNLSKQDIEKEFYRLRDFYFPNAVSPYQWSENIEVLAQIKTLFSEMQARKEKEYAIKKLEVEFKEAEILKNNRKKWNENLDGKAPSIDYFKAEARLECKNLWEEVFNLKAEAQQFKSVSESYDDRIAAIKYRINAMKIEGGING